MIEMRAKLFCDRCDCEICEMVDVIDENDAYRRLAIAPEWGCEDEPGWGCEDENGNDVCAKCWQKWDAEHRG